MESSCEGFNDGTYFISGTLLKAADAGESLSWSCGSLLAIVFLAVDAWRAFQKKQHWIPCDSLLLGSLSLLLLALLNIPTAALFEFPKNKDLMWRDVNNLTNCSETISRWMVVLGGRVSLCVVMGCMLPGLARPRSSSLSLWSDMAALVITSSPTILHLGNEIYLFAVIYHDYYYPDDNPHVVLKLLLVTFTLLVSFVILILLLASATLASISVHKTVSHKISLILSASTLQRDSILPNSYLQSIWERLEEQIVKSWIVVCTSNPQYIIARSVLSSSVALVITVCNGILLFEVVKTEFTVSIYMVIHWIVIILGSSVIYWRWITTVVFYPKSMGRKSESIAKYFQIEDFWKRYLLDLKDGHKSHRQMGDSYLKILMVNIGRRLRVHKLVPLAVWLQILLVLFSKVCWLVSQLLFSNIYLRKLLMGSSVDEFPSLYGGSGSGENELGKSSYYEKYSKAFVTMNDEIAACLWVANRKCIQDINRQMKRGQEEGQMCKELVTLLKNKCPSGYRNFNPPCSVPTRLEVERVFDICQCSCKMRAVAIISVIVELCPFTEDVKKAIEVIEAYSQAWNVMDLVDNPDTKAFQVSKVADKLFQGLQKRGKLLTNNSRMSNSVNISSEAARIAMRKLVEKAKKTTEEYLDRTWNEVVESYSLWKVCVNMGLERFNKVEDMMDESVRTLGDEMRCCMGKALDMIMEDSQKWAIMAMEQRISTAACILGKVKTVMEDSGWLLKCNAKEGIGNASSMSIGFPTLRKLPTFQIA